ncbi:hypothetical protein [Rhizobium sp. 2MFCol3.1]|uniref:hypothetical protein n=1 Tax=Rhizobium sp. 2MFCol3.1 TaxID=1246459 RepID=UPI00036B1DC0|nr:hypothetical protein [Rhizobium sp. 2MFCol3.1]
MTNIYNEGVPTAARGLAKSTLTAFFDSRSDAEAAIDKLKSAGVSDVRLMPGYEANGDGPAAAAEKTGFWSGLSDWFFPDEDRDVYAEGLRRGGFLVCVSVDQARYDEAHDILDAEGSIDMDERADRWREEGWATGSNQQASASKEDVFQADEAAVSATGVGRYARSSQATSPRVRAYDLVGNLPDDIVDDVVPTGHQRDVSEGDRPLDERAFQEQSIDDLRQSQMLPGSR